LFRADPGRPIREPSDGNAGKKLKAARPIRRRAKFLGADDFRAGKIGKLRSGTRSGTEERRQVGRLHIPDRLRTEPRGYGGKDLTPQRASQPPSMATMLPCI